MRKPKGKKNKYFISGSFFCESRQKKSDMLMDKKNEEKCLLIYTPKK